MSNRLDEGMSKIRRIVARLLADASAPAPFDPDAYARREADDKKLWLSYAATALAAGGHREAARWLREQFPSSVRHGYGVHAIRNERGDVVWVRKGYKP